MTFRRNDVEASPEEKYLASLHKRVAALSEKAWSELSPEEKDSIAELSAVQAGRVKASGTP